MAVLPAYIQADNPAHIETEELVAEVEEPWQRAAGEA